MLSSSAKRQDPHPRPTNIHGHKGAARQDITVVRENMDQRRAKRVRGEVLPRIWTMLGPSAWVAASIALKSRSLVMTHQSRAFAQAMMSASDAFTGPTSDQWRVSQPAPRNSGTPGRRKIHVQQQAHAQPRVVSTSSALQAA